MIIAGTLAFLGAFLVGGVSCRAIELPFREILLGKNSPSLFEESDSLQSLLVQWETRFWDLYRTEQGRRLQDYHQLDSRVSALARSGWLLYGFEGGRNALTLEQANVFTNADRMSGGRTLDDGGLLLGVDGAVRRIPGTPRGRALGSLGWGAGVEASLEAMLAWEGRAFVSVRAMTAATKIEINEEIDGHYFPFRFPFRTDGFQGESAVTAGGFQVAAFGSLDVSHGDYTGSDPFQNALYFRWISLGASVRRGIKLLPGNASLLRRLDSPSSFPGYSLSFAINSGNGDIGMERDGVRYLHLEDADFGDTSVRFDFLPVAGAYCSVGWQRLRVEHDGDSFFDVWPFSIWDVFSAKRYRLGHVAGRIDLWHLGGGCMIRRKHFNAELRAQFEHINDSFSLRWYEREDILYPFIFTYVAHDETPSIQYRYAVQIEPVLSIRATEHLMVTLSGSGILPFGQEKKGGGTAPPAPPSSRPGEERRSHGGLLGTIVLTYEL
jgi:hypothetical protein